jgi:hypothetical protein
LLSVDALMRSLTIEKRVDDELAVLLHQVIDVPEDATVHRLATWPLEQLQLRIPHLESISALVWLYKVVCRVWCC